MIITIPGQTRAKKNSMKVITFGKGPKARYSLTASTIYKKWEKVALEHLLKNYARSKWMGLYPIEIHFFLFRENRRKWDIDNVYCGCLDVLQKMDIIVDDSANHVIPVFAGWALDKYNPRVVLNLKPVTKQYYREDLNVL